MSASSDSEQEFWTELEHRPGHSKSSGFSKFARKAFSTMRYDQFKAQLGEFLPKGYQRHKLFQIVDQIREASKAQHEISMKLALKDLDKFYRKKINGLTKQNLLMIEELKVDYDKLKILLTKKDYEISRIESLFTDQEGFIDRQRIVKEALMKVQPSEIPAKREKYKKKKRALKDQIQGFKELVQLYHSQTDHSQSEQAKAEAYLKKKEKEWTEMSEQMQKEINDTEKKYELQIKGMNDRFDVFKNELNRELDVNKTIIHKQEDLIKTLQNELRNVKIVMHTPRLKIKYQDRLKATNTLNDTSPTKQAPKKLHPIKKYFNRPKALDLKKSQSPEYLSNRESSGFQSPDKLSLPPVKRR